MGYYGGTIIRGKVDRHTSILREAMYQLTRIVQNKFHYVEFRPKICFICCSPEKARAVVVPLLTTHAIDLLQNCLSSKETDFWMALGPNWTLAKYV